MDRAPTEVAAGSNLKTRKVEKLVLTRQTYSPLSLIQLFSGFASDINPTNIYRDIRDGNWLSSQFHVEKISSLIKVELLVQGKITGYSSILCRSPV